MFKNVFISLTDGANNKMYGPSVGVIAGPVAGVAVLICIIGLVAAVLFLKR